MNTPSCNETEARGLPPWLATTLLRRRDLATRFVYWRQRLARQSRGWRRRLRRQLAVSVTGAALLLAVAGAQAQIGPAATDNAITVVNGQVGIAANGQCSLMEAIQNANNKTNGRPYTDCAAGNPNGADTINLPTNGLFTINNAFLPDALVGPIGLPWISTEVTINGNGSTIQRGNNAPDFRVMAVGYQGNLTLNNTTIRGGNLTNEGCSEDFYNYTPTSGAGILNQGQLTISGSTITGNQIECSGIVSGGGIFSSGILNVSTSTIRDNILYGDYSAFGGGIDNSGTLSIITSDVDGNLADAYIRSIGGGIYSSGTLTISGSTIRDNAAYGVSGGYGGGIGGGGNLSISHSTLSGNRSFGNHGSSGGGIDARGPLTITDSNFHNNQASAYDGSTSGVAVTAFDTSYISGSTFVANSILIMGDNSPEILPAIGNYGTMVIANSTVSANQILGVGNYGDLTIANSTITANVSGVRAVCGWGSAQDITRLQRTIVSGNAGSEVVLGNGDQDDCPAISVNSHNLFGQNGNAGVTGFTPGPTDIVPTAGLNAILSPLADNGGPTQTHALPAGSPALDRAPNNSCTAAPVNGLDQRGQPRNQNGSGSASSNECDVGAFERAGSATPVGAFYLSTAKAGTVGGVAFAPADIIKYDPVAGWSLYFDGSDVGITKNVTAFELQADGSILLSLVAAQTVPGAGSVQPQDILRFTPTATGPNTAGTFQLWIDGSNVGLTTAAEKIDALGLAADGRIAVSTTGAAAVAGPSGTTISAADEDVLGFNRATTTWSALLDFTALSGMKPEDVNALWINPTTGEVFVSLGSAFNLGGVVGDAKDIIKLTPNGSSYTPSLHWDGSAAGFPAIIDGLEMIQ